MEKFIPVEAKVGNKYYIWYMDVSSLSLNDLVNLKNELIGTRADSIVMLDALIYDNVNWKHREFKSIKRENQRLDNVRNYKVLNRKKHRRMK